MTKEKKVIESGPKYGKGASEKVAKTMHERKQGTKEMPS
jgi:hypothetical protein